MKRRREGEIDGDKRGDLFLFISEPLEVAKECIWQGRRGVCVYMSGVAGERGGGGGLKKAMSREHFFFPVG